MREAVVVDAVRTPMGRSKGGMFRNVRAETLSAEVMNALLRRNPELDPAEIEDVVWGCVQQTLEQAFNVARFAQLLDADPEAGRRADREPAVRLVDDGASRRRRVDPGRLRRRVPGGRRRAHGPPADDPRPRLQPDQHEAQRQGRGRHGPHRRVPGADPRHLAAAAGRVRAALAPARAPGDRVGRLQGRDRSGRGPRREGRPQALRHGRGDPPRHDARGALRL